MGQTAALSHALAVLPADWTNGRRYRHVLVLNADRPPIGLMDIPIPVNPY
ncbi:MAG: hypothetical protein ACUVT2_05595 [Thiobacillaceae bacterium]